MKKHRMCFFFDAPNLDNAKNLGYFKSSKFTHINSVIRDLIDFGYVSILLIV